MTRAPRWLLTLFVTALLAACAAPAAPAPTPAPATEPTAAPAPAAQPASAFGATPRGEHRLQVLETTGEYRRIKHMLGETKVPLIPQRVVTTQDQNGLLPIFELGFTNVVGSLGQVRPDGTPFFRRMEKFDTSQITFVGIYPEINYEQLTLLKPDLIVGTQIEITADNYETLSAIAPTVVVEMFTDPIWFVSADYALLVGKEAESKAFKEQFDARVAALREKIGDPAQVTASILGFDEGKLAFENGYSAMPTVFASVGLQPSALQKQTDDEVAAEGDYRLFSMELLPRADGDLIFVPVFAEEESNPGFEAAKASPLWSQLNAVQKGQVYEIDAQRWFGGGFQPLFNALDDLERILVTEKADVSWTAPQG